MKVIYNEKARELLEEYPVVPRALDHLQEVVGQSGEQVVAEWDRSDVPRRQPGYTLTLREDTAEVQARFAPEGLVIPAYVSACLYRLWGDLLQKRSDEQHRKVLHLAAQLEGEGECPGQPTTNSSEI